MNVKRILLMGLHIALLATATASHGGNISFSGYTWVVRSSGRGGPGPNSWEPNNVSVDTNGYLHLRLTQRDGKWYCAELHTRERLGFGRYEFWLKGPVDRMDRNVVLGLFNYPTADVGRDGTHEIDIEFAQWGNSFAPSGNYTVWPATNGVRHESKAFPFKLDGDSSKHSFTWTSTNVVFESEEGEGGSKARQLAAWRFEPANPAARISQRPMPVHINLWCFKGQPPGDGKEVELIVRAFKFTPL
jgi:Glycosyl hydrolases family 16